MVVAVIFIHTLVESLSIGGERAVSKGQFPLYDVVRHVVSCEWAGIAVPLFFFMSGFLFFYRSGFTLDIYKQKITKRAKTLLIPYIIWNVAVIFCYLLGEWLVPSSMPGSMRLTNKAGVWEWLSLFWNAHAGAPAYFPFWFLRDLMVVILSTPVLYVLLRYGRLFFVILLAVLWLFGLWFDVPGVGSTAFFFFSFGAWFSLNKRCFTEDFRKLRWPSTVFYSGLVVCNTWLWQQNITDYAFLQGLGTLIGLVMVLSWTAHGVRRGGLQMPVFLEKSAFFVYAFHGVPISVLSIFWVKWHYPLSEAGLLSGYFLLPVVVTGLSVGVYALLRRYVPSFTALITGER